jgi:hypothetical protein
MNPRSGVAHRRDQPSQQKALSRVGGVVKLGRFLLYLATVAALALVAVASASASSF